MANLLKVASILLFVAIGLVPYTGAALSRDDASRLLSAFVSAASRGDRAAISICWSKKSLERKGFFASLHSRIGQVLPLEEFAAFLRSHTFEVYGIKRENNHFILEFEWVAKDTISTDTLERRIPMRYYVVEEEGRFVFINPVDLLTQEWRTYRNGILTFHYSSIKDTRGSEAALQRMNSLCLKISELLESYLPLPEQVDVYVAGSGVEVGELLLYPPAGGYALVARDLIVSPTFINPHEYVHLITMHDGDFINAAFAEGIAVALGGTYWSAPDYSLAVARHLIDEPGYIPAEKLLLSDDKDFLANAHVTYHEAGAFSRFLIDEYGIDKLLELSERCDLGEDLQNAFTAIYESKISELEAKWHDYLRRPDVPELGYTIPNSAESVFSMEDRSGDDNGDGRFIYPTDRRFEAGTFDLTSFEVFSDTSNIYFRIGFNKLGRSILDTATGHTYIPGAVITINRGAEYGDHFSRRCSGLTFGNDGYNIRLDIGTSIIVSNSFGRNVYVSDNIRDRISRWDDNAIEFSIPVSLIGRPSVEWRYFVGTALINDIGFGFMRSFPMGIRREASAFRFAGVRDQYSSPFVDVLLPDGVDQGLILRGVTDDKVGRKIPMPMVGPRSNQGH
jgi:hypothetical protein